MRWEHFIGFLAGMGATGLLLIVVFVVHHWQNSRSIERFFEQQERLRRAVENQGFLENTGEDLPEIDSSKTIVGLSDRLQITAKKNPEWN